MFNYPKGLLMSKHSKYLLRALTLAALAFTAVSLPATAQEAPPSVGGTHYVENTSRGLTTGRARDFANAKVLPGAVARYGAAEGTVTVCRHAGRKSAVDCRVRLLFRDVDETWTERAVIHVRRGYGSTYAYGWASDE